MELMLEIISRQKFSPDIRTTYIFSEAGGYIGRSEESNWVLPDRTKKISRRHVFINSDGENFYLEDVSSNGVLSTLTRELVGKNGRHKISHGDSFQIGDYVFQARLLKTPDKFSFSDFEESSSNNSIIPDDAFLDVDPLIAMDQQEIFDAKQRLGLYNDLLGEKIPEETLASVSDHSESRLDAMLQIKPTQEVITPIKKSQNQFMEVEPQIQKNLAGKFNEINIPIPHDPSIPEDFIPELPRNEVKQSVVTETKEVAPSDEADLFFKALGLEEIPSKAEDRKRIMLEAADLIKASVEGMVQSLKNRADSKNELRLPITTIQITGNNPYKFSSTASVAINQIFAKHKNNALRADQAMLAGFDDLHGHHLGLLAGARAAMSAALERLSPEKISEKLDSAGVVKFKRHNKLWQTFINMHEELSGQDGLADFFLHDFARAYEMQLRTLQSSGLIKQEGANK